MNCQSCREISSEIHEVLINENIDLAFLSETWLRSEGDEVYISAITENIYNISSFPRLHATNRSGGSIAIVYKKNLSKHITCRRLQFLSFECVEVKIKLDKVSAVCLVIYRRFMSKRQDGTTNLFFPEFPDLLTEYVSKNINLSIQGDFNYHFDEPNSRDMIKMGNILSDFNLCQLVDAPTHRHGHILDWILVNKNDKLLNFTNVKKFPGLSDHYAVFSSLHVTCPSPNLRTITSRNIREISKEGFQYDIRNLVTSTNDIDDVNSLVDTYNKGLRKILDNHAPEVSRTVRDRLPQLWMDEEVREERRKRRRAERKWRKTGLTVDEEIYLKANAKYQKFKDNKRKDYNSQKIKSCNSTKQIYVISNSLLGKTKCSSLPSDITKQEMPKYFSDYFAKKIQLIRENLDSSSLPSPEFKTYNGPMFNEFHTVSEDFVKKVISQMPTKSCILDPMPTNLVKDYVHELIPLITQIINTSLTSGIVPSSFKEAIVIALLKEKGKDVNNFKNYRPVSNLPFISKVLERVVLQQLLLHLSENNLSDLYQAAYRSGHSTETAVLSVTNSLLMQSDDHQVSVVGLLDLSSAFDTIDHTILLKRLQLSFGIEGRVLDWFESYVSNRFQSVIVDGLLSEASSLLYGVPQGSVLGPILFTLYSQPLSDIISSHDLQYQKYADDTEISSSSKPDNFTEALDSLATCTEDVSRWMSQNKLKINTDKTEVMPVGIKSCLNKISEHSIELDGLKIEFKECIKYLGVYLDPTLSMKNHISNVCRGCFLEIRRISSIKKYLNREALIQLVVTTVLSRLDYCNSTLSNISDEQFHHLQRVQNAATRLILGKSKHDHVTPMLKELQLKQDAFINF